MSIILTQVKVREAKEIERIAKVKEELLKHAKG